MNIFVFQLFYILNFISFVFGVSLPILYRKLSNELVEHLDKFFKVLLVIYASSFVSFIMFQTNPLYIVGTGYDLFISFMSGYLISRYLLELVGYF